MTARFMTHATIMWKVTTRVISCHDSHTLEVQVEECTVCHTDVTSVEDFANVRMNGFAG